MPRERLRWLSMLMSPRHYYILHYTAAHTARFLGAMIVLYRCRSPAATNRQVLYI